MIDFALKYQAVIFASLEEISPSPDILKYFIEEFKDKGLIPSMFQEITANGKISNRFIFKSLNDEWEIEFGINRLNIKKVNRDIHVSNFGTKKEFLEEVVKIVNVIFNKFPHKANRISFVTQYFIKPTDSKGLNSIASKVSILSKTYQDNPPINWNHRYVSRMEKKISEKNEIVNFIGEINRVQGNLKINSKIEEFDRVELKFDINTFQGNQEFRFSINDIEDFYEKVYEWEDILLNEFLKIME
ncbi:hypothetical protein ISS22_16535 [candidate division KSB1 bacterium]|nr:hypothetical protein [candidate division KSB1 bacterium]